MLATSPTHPNRHPHPIHHPPRDTLLQAFFANPEASAVASDPVRLQDMPPQAQRAISAYLDDPGDADAAPEWDRRGRRAPALASAPRIAQAPRP
jgi:hypothetical protein